jgi:hypothetical protein
MAEIGMFFGANRPRRSMIDMLFRYQLEVSRFAYDYLKVTDLGASRRAHRGIMRVIFDHLRPGGPHNA